MSLNQSLISDFSEYYRWSQRTKIKYKLHYCVRGDDKDSLAAEVVLDSEPQLDHISAETHVPFMLALHAL